jgi:hypothetical protein
VTAQQFKVAELLAKFACKVLRGPKTIARIIAIATLSLAELFIGLLEQGIVTDIRRVKESLVRKMEAEADAADAEAQKKMADAAKAANEANLHKRKDAIARIKLEQEKVKVAKTEAEAEAIRKDAETRRLQAVTEAQARLMEAIGKLRREGGNIYFDRNNLEKIIGGFSAKDGTPENSRKDRVSQTFAGKVDAERYAAWLAENPEGYVMVAKKHSWVLHRSSCPAVRTIRKKNVFHCSRTKRYARAVCNVCKPLD